MKNEWSTDGVDVVKDIENAIALLDETPSPLECDCKKLKKFVKENPDRMVAQLCYRHNILYSTKAMTDTILNMKY